jgi:tetratricopeptide (TPR) repeat protein
LGANQAAIDLLKQCIALYPKYKEPDILIGVILANNGHYKESIKFWEEGLAIDPTDPRLISYINEAKYLTHK